MICLLCSHMRPTAFFFFFFFNDPAPTEISPLSLHDALPILVVGSGASSPTADAAHNQSAKENEPSLQHQFLGCRMRSEEHTSELQSRLHLVCRLLLEKKKKSIRTITGRECYSPYLSSRTRHR